MLQYLLRRAGQALVVLVGAAVLVFALIHIVPGDPVRVALGTRFDPATYEAMRAATRPEQPNNRRTEQRVFNPFVRG